MNEKRILDLGYDTPRWLPSGEWAALLDFLFTTGLVVGLGPLGYRTRFCYPTREEAARALQTWDGSADPPRTWIKEKGIDGERSNPRATQFHGIQVIEERAALSG